MSWAYVVLVAYFIGTVFVAAFFAVAFFGALTVGELKIVLLAWWTWCSTMHSAVTAFNAAEKLRQRQAEGSEP